MKYYIINSAFDKHGRTIETEKSIEELIDSSKNGLIPLKGGGLVGVDLLKNSLIIPVKEESSGLSEVAGYFH